MHLSNMHVPLPELELVSGERGSGKTNIIYSIYLDSSQSNNSIHSSVLESQGWNRDLLSQQGDTVLHQGS
jgi:hypothetical protein